MTKSYEETIAGICGINASVLFLHIKFWIQRNEKDGRNFFEGRTWMYKTLAAFHETFPYFSVRMIGVYLKKLVDCGLIIKSNFNKTHYDRTSWYALSDEAIEILSESSEKAENNAFHNNVKSNTQICEMESTDTYNGKHKYVSPIPSKETSIETECINQNIIFSEDDEKKTRSADNSFSNEAKEILSELGMKREPTKAELILYEKWRREFLLPHDVILKSCELTGRAAVPSFTYLDKVLISLRDGGVCDMATYGKYKDRQKRHEDYCSELFAKMGLSQNPTFTQRERIRQFLDEYHLSRDILNLAADRARQNSNPYDYLCRAATSLYERDIISSMSEARDFLDRSSKTQAYSPVKRDGYAMHRYTAEDLAHIGVDLDED